VAAAEDSYLAGRRALVVGAGGLGAVCLEHLAGAGATVLGTRRSATGAGSGLIAFNYPEDSFGALLGTVRERLGAHLDVLIYAAGPALTRAVDATTGEELVELLRVNAAGFHEAMLAFTPMMGAGGRVVAFTVAGAGELAGRTMLPAYFAAKAAQLSLLKSWALKLAPRGISVNAVAPGVFAGEVAVDEGRIPAGRPGKPGDLVAALRFLLSAEGGYSTGNSITVSGGYGI